MIVAIGLLGTTLDGGYTAKRWERWRPTIDLCRSDDLVIDRLELIHTGDCELANLIAEDIAVLSPDTEVRLHELPLDDPWDFEEVFGALHDFARDYPFRIEEEEYLVHITTGTHVTQICLFLLTESRHFPAKLVQTSPPTAKRNEPGSYAIIDLDLSTYDRLAQRFVEEHQQGVSFLKQGIETRSPRFNEMIEAVERVAIASRAPLLLSGPTGAGKSQLARRIYELKHARRQVSGKLVEVNCATLRGDQAMSTLFGHMRGAFTGALSDRAGLLRTAHGGVLFLDEIGDLGLDEQAMLLRAIEERRFLPMGSDTEVASDFQLIAGTNANLRERVQAARFREDLLARIDLWSFELPGLADRKEDIEPNLDFELTEWTRRAGTRVTMNREARERFLRFAESNEAVWTSSFRDFNAAVERMATLALAGRIGVPEVDDEIERLRSRWRSLEAHDELVAEALGAAASELDRFERVQLADVLSVCRSSTSLSAAGRALFAVSRTKKKSRNDADRLRKYLARFDLEFDQLN